MDEIDIEEHDVMDNPRIKSIFPDLSCVKIEIPDDEDIEDQYEEIPIDYEHSEIHYQYECNSFQTTTEIVPEQSNPEYEEDEAYFYNNEIILGSKSTIDPEVLYEEALNSRPIVFIENWEYKLKTSPCFCETCNILFSTVNALDAHKMVSHSYLVALDTPQRNTARKSTVTCKFCHHCSKTFPDDTSLIKHLYELLPMNNFPKVKEEIGSSEVKEEADEEHQYQCLTCKETFVTHAAGRWHRKVAHPAIRQVNTIVKRNAKKIKFNPKRVKVEPEEGTDPTVKIEPGEIKLEPKEIKREFGVTKYDGLFSPRKAGTFFAASYLLPKNTLFQCNVCQVGFLSCVSAIHHSKMCEKLLPFHKCRICKRKIRAIELKLHELQHSLIDKFKVYNVSESLYDKILCRCPKCQACTDELFFLSHYKSCNNSGSAYCPDCDLTIVSTRYSSHRQKHLSNKLMKKDCILVEFHDNVKFPKDIKREVLEIERRKQRIRQRTRNTKLSKHSKVEDVKDIKFYYCHSCGCCQSVLSHRGHMHGECKKKIWGVFCEKCGLCFSNKSIHHHRMVHDKRQFTLKNVKIYSLTTGLYMDPPMSEFFKCRKCEKRFLFRRQVTSHDCKTEKHVTCKICSKIYNLQAYKVHKQFHTLDEALLPQLMKKYNSINNMWNIIYMCLSCELVTMTYDSAVEHSQGHLNNIETDQVKNCTVCNFNIAERHYEIHEKLHVNNESLERSTFITLKYNYEDLFKDVWMSLLEALPKQHKQQILSESIYRYTRSVKMHLEINAPTDDVKYLCMNCKCFVDGTNIALHLNSQCTPNDKYVCSICHEVFKTVKTFTAHKSTHEKLPKKHKIVIFNQDHDKVFNRQLQLLEQESKNVNNKVSNKKSKLRQLLNEVKKKYIIYKCTKCLTCVSLKKSIRRHHCNVKERSSFCVICQQRFSNKKFNMHMEAHKLKPHVNKDTLAIIYFNGQEKATYKLSQNTKPKPIPTKPKPIPIKSKPIPTKSKPIPTKSKLIPTKSKPIPTKPKPIPSQPKLVPINKHSVSKILKCECGLHFTSMKTIQTHLDTCSPDVDVSRETCSKCNLVFPTDVLVTHLVNHHSKEVNTVIVNIKRLQLFKCSHCLLIFTSIDLLNAHNEVCDPKHGKKCNNCHLIFEKTSFIKHKCIVTDNESTTYINKITTIKKSAKVVTVFKCGQCDISYLQYKSYKYHVTDVNHAYKINLTTCEYCGLRFTQYSWQKHVKLHSANGEAYVIKVIDPIEGTSSKVTGTNPVKAHDPTKSLSRKRNFEAIGVTPRKYSSRLKSSPKKIRHDSDTDTENIYTKIVKKSPTDRADRLYNRLSRKEFDFVEPNTSKVDLNKDTNAESDISQDDTQILSNKLKSRILVGKYDNRLFRCKICYQHYMRDTSFEYHVKTNDHKEMPEIFKCDICDIGFSKHTLPRHIYVHHQKMQLNKEDFIIITVNNDLESCNNDSETLNASEIAEDTSNTEITKDLNVTENGDDITEGPRDNNITNEDTSAVEVIEDHSDVTQTASENVNQSVSEVSKTTDENILNVSGNSEAVSSSNNASEDICYFKCAECNVCFINRRQCYNHTLNHEILDSRTYIQCKICDFQFMIDSLKEHMDKHHSTDFKVEHLTIEEYKPLGDGVEPKIDTYYATDKVQSRLVSTTTDMGVV